MSRAIWTRGQSMDPAIVEALEATGLPWSVEPGSKHRKIMLAGRLAAVISLKSAGGQNKGGDGRNVLSAIRRTARAVKQC